MAYLWIPKQVQKAREEAEKRRANSKKASIVLLAGPLRRSDMESIPEELQRNALKSYAQLLGLYPAFWDRWIPTAIPMSLIKRRVYQRLGELEVDDFAIQRDGGVGKMEGEERGIDILAKEEKNLRRDLEQWMERRAEKTDERIRRSTGTGK
ncbi:MAG: hypothetical protein ASARMPRED_008098 [Alectoria sarmentosa]|nr:MAG: hypothetical protein ASARMPRED_008098 [Alectoria sarmentosa]